MSAERAIKGKECFEQSIALFTARKPQEAVALLEKGMADFGDDFEDFTERYIYSNLLHHKFIFLSIYDGDAAADAAKESLKFDETLDFIDSDAQALACANTAYKHIFLGNISEAISIADKIDLDSPEIKESDLESNVYQILFDVYSKSQYGYDFSRFEKIAKKFISICKEERNDIMLLDIFRTMSQEYAQRENATAAIDMCEKGWELARKIGFGNVDAETLLKLCLAAIATSEGSALVKWSRNTLECINALLDYTDVSVPMASA
ncbi:MAG: hypothetical protein LBC41_08545, partial [Clostridiales bacterium]|nr:hypothetical protein [Clostridiales bacterium]